MNESPEHPHQKPANPSENIWGWKFSRWGAIIIFTLLAIVAIRAWYLGVNPFQIVPEQNSAPDSLRTSQ